MVRAESMQIPAAGHKSEHVALLNGDCATSVMPCTKPPKKPFNRMFTYDAIRLFISRPLILAFAIWLLYVLVFYAFVFLNDNSCHNDSLVFV